MASATPPEDIVAGILHALSTNARSSPLLCKCTREEPEGGRRAPSWDPFISFASSTESGDSNGPRKEVRGEAYARLLQNLLAKTGVKTEDVAHIKKAFADKDQLDVLFDGGEKPGDVELWHAGLDLLRTLLFPGGENGEESLEPIPPHILLQTVMDSYYCRDADFELGHLSATEDATSSDGFLFQLPSSLALFFLRSYLIAHALKKAEESIQPSLELDEPVRWRRLKSMADDALALFRRMVFDYAGHAVNGAGNAMDTAVNDRLEPSKQYPVTPDLVIQITSWSYCNLIFPSCRGLLGQLLRNRNKMPSKTLESCYESFKLATSLLALEATTVERDYAQPSRCYLLISERIECLQTEKFFSLVKNAQEEINRRDIEEVEMQDGGYRPWKDEGPNLSARGWSLEEDLLLSPSLRKLHENSDKASAASFYDEVGIGLIAYWKLRASVDASMAIDALPCPYSGSYRWSLLFPHTITLLCGLEASATMEKMDKDEVLCKTDDSLATVGCIIVSFGFDMLHTLIEQMPAIRPSRTFTETQNPIVKWAQSAQGLQSTIVVLLLHVMRLSSLELSRGDKPPSEIFPVLKYSSAKVLEMTQTLLRFYDPSSQILALSAVCQHIETKDKVLLPKLLDFVRPIVMGTLNNVEQYNNQAILMKDVAIMKEASKTMDLFLNQIHEVFDASSAPLPRDVGEFIASRETYSSVFSIVRWQRAWIARCEAVEELMKADKETLQRFRRISNWMESCLDKMKKFEQCLARLIDFWEATDDRPEDWHQLFLIRLALQDALAQPEKWESY